MAGSETHNDRHPREAQTFRKTIDRDNSSKVRR